MVRAKYRMEMCCKCRDILMVDERSSTGFNQNYGFSSGEYGSGGYMCGACIEKIEKQKECSWKM